MPPYRFLHSYDMCPYAASSDFTTSIRKSAMLR